jgi:hypothetical protein
MLGFLRGKVSDRKLRLFVCACCRKLFPFLAQHGRKAVRIAERYADGEVSSVKLRYAWESARRLAQTSRRGRRDDPATGHDYAHWAVALVVEEDLDRMIWSGQFVNSPLTRGQQAGLFGDIVIDEAALLRDIFNPFKPVVLDPTWLAWNDRTPVKLALAIYDGCAFDRLPILADALEDAGCDKAIVLEHLRHPGPHARGCWPLDLVLGAE